MKYLGSKRRIGPELCDVIFTDAVECMPWVEPFAGGLNMTNHVIARRKSPLLTDTLQISTVHLNELNPYIVALIKAYKSGWTIYDYAHPEIYEHDCPRYGVVIGPRVSEKLYYDIRNNMDNYPPEVVGFCMSNLSFGGVWGGTYAREGHRHKKNGGLDVKGGLTGNYTRSGNVSIKKSMKNWHWDDFQCGDYLHMKLPPPPAVIYCDPPYKNTAKYKDEFDHDIFYDWCRERTAEGYTVYISEYQMPDDFKLIKTIKTKVDFASQRKAPKFIEEYLFKV